MCICVCVCVRIHVWVCMCMCLWGCVSVYICALVCDCVYAHMCTCMCGGVCIYVRTCAYVYMYAPTRACTHMLLESREACLLLSLLARRPHIMYLNTFNETCEPKQLLGAGLQPRSGSLLARVSQLSGSRAEGAGGMREERKEALALAEEGKDSLQGP